MKARASGILSFTGSVLAGTGRSGLLLSPFVVLVIRLTVGQSGLSGAAADGMSFALIEFLAALMSIGLAAHLIAHESPAGRTEYWEFLSGSRVSWWLGKVLGVWICLGLCLFTVWPASELAWFLAGRSGSESVHSLSECRQELRGLAIDGATAGLGAASIALSDRLQSPERPICLAPQEAWLWRLERPAAAIWIRASAISPGSAERSIETPASFELELEAQCGSQVYRESLRMKPHAPFLLYLPATLVSQNAALLIRLRNPSMLESVSLIGSDHRGGPLPLRALESLELAGSLREMLVRALLILWIELLPFTALAALLALAISPESVAVLVLAACIVLGQPLFEITAPVGLSGAGSLMLRHRIVPTREALRSRLSAALGLSLGLGGLGAALLRGRRQR